MSFTPRRSSPRLPAFAYEGPYTYHVVLSTQRHLRRFRDGQVVSACLACLDRSAIRYGFRVLAYCFMPDHLHLLVQGSEQSSLIRFVQHFKQATGYHYKGVWQRSYYDHVLRDEESVTEVAAYIWSNPVVAGLAADAASYPYSGPRLVLEGEAGLTAGDRAEALSLQSEGPSRP